MALAIMFAFNTQAQVALNEKGLYQHTDGTLYTGVIETLNEAGTRKSVLNVKEGMLHGKAIYYFADGRVMENGMFENGLKTGEWTRFSESGITIGLAAFNAGKKHGTWLVWDDKGNKLFEMHYNNGEKAGVWNNWDSTGQLLSSKDFGNGN